MVETTKNNGDKTATEKKFEKRRKHWENPTDKKKKRNDVVWLLSARRKTHSHPLRLFLRKDVWEVHAPYLRKQQTYTAATSYRTADKRQYNLDN